MYKKPIEELTKTVHYEPLPAQMRQVIIAGWIRGQLLPKSLVEERLRYGTGTS
jgi:hypothetical protein